MDYFFSRFSHPHMSVEDGIIFNGNVVDSEGKPFHIELTINGINHPRYCDFSITTPNSSWLSVSSLDYDFVYKERKVNPLRKTKSKFTRLLSAQITIRFEFGTFDININDTMVSINENFHIPF